MRLFVSGPLLAALVVLASNGLVFTPTARADSTGLENIHTLVRTGNRLCMAGHFHYGSGHSQKSKALALADAKRKWADFVIAEYGTDWGRFSLAAARGGHCRRDDVGGYACTVSASPCKALRRAYRVRRARRHLRRHRRYARARRHYRRRHHAVRHRARRHIRMARRGH